MVANNQNKTDTKILGQLKGYKADGTAKAYQVLDDKNDPFWVSRSRERDAKWIAGIWEKYGSTNRWPGYDRGIHYFILGLGLGCPWGKNRRVHTSEMYMNVTSDWGNLCRSIRDARNWNLIPWNAITNKQSVGLETWVDYGGSWKQKMPFEDFDGEVNHYLSVTIPEVKEISEAKIYENSFDDEVGDLINQLFDDHTEGLTSTRYQPYYVCVVSEKQGLRNIVRNTLRELNHGFDFLNYEGQATTTVVKSFVDRLLYGGPTEHSIANKKIRIFYLADFDFAGRIMVPAFAWKLYYLLLTMGESELDIKIRPLALTKEQVEKYDLPPAPVSPKSLGAGTLQNRWLREFGKIIEIDSLMALHPGELEKIIVDAVNPYIDWDLESEIESNIEDWRNDVSEGVTDDLESLRSPWEEVHKKLSEATVELNKAIEEASISKKLSELTTTIDAIKEKHNIADLVEKYENSMKNIEIDADYYASKFDKPESTYEADESDDWLYDSSRNPGLQAQMLREYKP